MPAPLRQRLPFLSPSGRRSLASFLIFVSIRRSYPVVDQSSADLPLLVSREQGENAFADAMRLYVGRGRRYSVKQLSNGTGVKDRLIECAMCASGTVDFRPLNMGAQLSIMKFLGPDFTSEWIKLAGQVAFHKPEGVDLDEVEARAREVLACKGAAHHPESPAGRELSACEVAELHTRVAHLRAVAA